LISALTWLNQARSARLQVRFQSRTQARRCARGSACYVLDSPRSILAIPAD
jgi:hypothetical protein